MHVVMLSTDRTVFDASSPTRKRLEEYAAALSATTGGGGLSVVVLSTGRRAPEIGVPLSLYPTNSSSRFFFVSDAARLGASLAPADVVSAQDPFETGLAGLRIARRLRVPLHVQVHADFLAPSAGGLGFASVHWPLNALRLRIAPRVLRAAAGIRAVSARIKGRVEARYHPPSPISVLPIYTDVGEYRHIPRARHSRFKTALLVVSRLEREKRVPLAIEGLAKARGAGVDCGLTVVGSGREEGALKRLAHHLGVEQWVEFAGFQNNLAPYYAVADALLYPGAVYEGYGMAIVEALAAGVPVLAEDVGVAREAGAAIAEGDFGTALVSFLRSGPPKGVLRYHPYASKEEYLKRFVDDLASCVTRFQHHV